MMLKVSTARSAVVLMVASSDHVTGLDSLTLTITASKDGGSFATITPTVTDLGNGFYKLALTTAHTDTLGDLALHITGTDADPTDLIYQVVTDLPGESVASVTSGVDVATVDGEQLIQTNGKLWVLDNSGNAIAPASDTQAIKSKTDNLPASPADTGDIPSAATIAATVRDVDNGSPAAGSLGEAARNADAKAADIQITLGTPVTSVSADIAAIQAKTTNLPASPAAVSDIPTAAENAAAIGEVDANVIKVNDVTVTGSGTTLDPWGPA